MANAGHTARERARAELTREIKAEARRQLESAGAGGLSLRAVARELGMVSSALYRYFPSRDDLLTALIIDAYDALGEVTERAVGTTGTARQRWRAAGHAVRDWARAHRHEYTLLYGSPVPGYQAPQDTIPPATRVPLALLTVLRDAHTEHRLATPARPRALTPVLAEQATALSALIAPEIPPALLVDALLAWTHLFGTISFELFGQLVGSVDPSDEFFAAGLEQQADLLGLPAD